MRTADVIIPTYKPDETFQTLVQRLCVQTVLPGKILVINTEEALWNAAPIDREKLERDTAKRGIELQVHHIKKEEFDHGGTRSAAASLSHAESLVFMTQDAVPADSCLMEKLMGALDQEGVAAAYARQLPAEGCSIIEEHTRDYNYGPESRVKSAADLPELGIKTYFCSNVCAAYDRTVFEKLGGFQKNMIFNEDMLFAAKLIGQGYKVAYEAQAKVIHSHNYTGAQQFHRNFDLAVSQAGNKAIFADVPSEGEGIRLVKDTAFWLCRTGKPYLLPKLFWQSACKYAGYLLGKNYQRLPGKMILKCSMNKKFWENKKI